MEKLANKYNTARMRSTTVIAPANTHDYYSLPSNCIGVLKITDPSGIPLNMSLYHIESLAVRFGALNSFTITYERKANNVGTYESSEPEIHPAYHSCIAKHVASRELARRNPRRSVELEQEFLFDANQAHITLNNIKRKGKVMKAPRWR